MPKYVIGETSKEVLAEKTAKTESLLIKAALIKKINNTDDIYPSLEVKRQSISLSSVLKWNDEKLGITKCAWNTAHARHNQHVLKTLLDSIEAANSNLKQAYSSVVDSSNNSSIRLSKNEFNLLITENEELRNALAEVYRAYIQALENINEDKVVNEVFRTLLKSQAQILGKQRIWQVK